MVSLAHGAPQASERQDDDEEIGFAPVDNGEGEDDEAESESDDEGGDDALANGSQSDVPSQLDNNMCKAGLDLKSDPTDLNNNGLKGKVTAGDGAGAGLGTASRKEQGKTVAICSGRENGRGSCTSTGAGSGSGSGGTHGGCGSPRSPLHGGVRTRGSRVQYFCTHGYRLLGPKQNTCIRTNGKHRWHSRTPKCKKISR